MNLSTRPIALLHLREKRDTRQGELPNLTLFQFTPTRLLSLADYLHFEVPKYSKNIIFSLLNSVYLFCT